jgi:hypothetical protein
VHWLVDKKRQGYKMPNSAARLLEMTEFMRGIVQQWNCRAGQNTLIIRTDGTLAPCFPMHNVSYDWGTIENPKFDSQQLREMKHDCQPHCFSTLNHIVVYCYNDCGWGQVLENQLPESYVAVLRSNIETRKTVVIQQSLALSDEQARKFWPLQRSYENDLSKLGDQWFDVIRDYVKNWDNLNDETARSLGKRLHEYHKRREDLHGKYFDRMSKEISPMVAAKFFQIETQLEEVIDLGISSSMPPIEQ